MSELFPSRRKVIGGSAAGLGRIVNFVGAGGRTPDLGPAIGQIGDIFQQYADNHYAKVADERLNDFTGEVLEAAQTFNFNQDATTFGDPFRDKIRIATEGLSAKAGAAFSAAANKVVTRAQADLVGQAYDRDVRDRQTADAKELGTLVSSLGPAINDARLLQQQFELEDPASAFELSVQNMVESVDGVVDSIELKIEQMRESGLYVGNEKLLMEAQSGAIRQTASYLTHSFIASADDGDLAEILNSASNNVLSDNLSPLKEFYDRMSEEDQSKFNNDIQKIVRSQDANNKIVRQATTASIKQTITDMQLSLQGDIRDVDGQSFRQNLQRSSEIVQSLKEMGLHDLASEMSKVMTDEIGDFSQLEEKQQQAIVALGPIIENYVTLSRNLGIPEAQIRARKNFLIDTFGKRGPSVGIDIGTVRGEARDAVGIKNAFEEEIKSLTKRKTLEKDASIEEKSRFNLINSVAEFRAKLANMPGYMQREYEELFIAIQQSPTMLTAQHVQAIDDLTSRLDKALTEFSNRRKAINENAQGSTPHMKAIDSFANEVAQFKIQQGDMPAILSAFRKTPDQELQENVLAGFGTEDDEELNARVDLQDRLSKTFNFFKTELDRGSPSYQLTQYIKSLSSASMPEDKDAADAMVENVMELAEAVHVLYGTKTLLEEKPSALSKYAGLNPKDESFVKTLSYLVQSGADVSQYRNYILNKNRTVTKEDKAAREVFIKDALGDFTDMFGNPANQLNMQQRFGGLETFYYSGSEQDIMVGGRIQGYIRERMERLLDIDPVLPKEALIRLAVDSIARDGLAFSLYGYPLDNPESIEQEQRYSLLPPDRVYGKEINNFLEFARETITENAGLPDTFKFFGHEKKSVDRKTRLQGSAFVLDEMVFGENVFFKKTEFSSANRPTYFAVARSESGRLTPILDKNGAEIVIDYNDQFVSDNEITRRKEINQVYQQAALNRQLDLRTNLLKYATDEAANEDASEEVYTQQTTLTDFGPGSSRRIGRFTNRQEPFRVDPMRSPEEYGDFDASLTVTDSALNAVDPTTLPLGDNFMDPTAPPQGIEGPRNPEDIDPQEDDTRQPLMRGGAFGSRIPPITAKDFEEAKKQAEKEGRSVQEVLSEEYPDFDATAETQQESPDLGELEGREVAIKRLPAILNFTKAQQINLETPQNSDRLTVDAAIQAVSSVFGGNTSTFLTRIGRQESALGQNKATFKKGRVDRGIWQISPIGLEEIKRNTPVLKRARQRIQEAFGIDVMELSLEDLEKPLHGAIAARLFLHSKNRGRILPEGLQEQAEFWKKFYNTAAGKGTVQQFIQNNTMAGV